LAVDVDRNNRLLDRINRLIRGLLEDGVVVAELVILFRPPLVVEV
jgi:hypothetical protein